MANRDFGLKIKVLPLVNNIASTTAPTYATTDSAASRGQSMIGFEEATVVAMVGVNPTTNTASFTIKLQESATLVDGDFADMPSTAGTQAARFFETETTPGTLIVAASAAPQSRLISIKVNERKPYVRAVPVNGTGAIPLHIDLILHEPRRDSFAQLADLRVVDDGGITV